MAGIKIKVEVLVQVDQSWGDDCTIGQMKKQAKEYAINLLTKQISADDRLTVINKDKAECQFNTIL